MVFTEVCARCRKNGAGKTIVTICDYFYLNKQEDLEILGTDLFKIHTAMILGA